jgi:uncharacterized protein YcbX
VLVAIGGRQSTRRWSSPATLDPVDPTAMSTPSLAAIWRYPVKSLQGEALIEADVESDGLRGDRRWGIRDRTTGKVLTGRREPRLLLAAATLTGQGSPEITLPSGDRIIGAGASTDTVLSDWLGRPVSLVAAEGSHGADAEFFADATDDTSQALEWTMPPGRFVDAMPLLVLTSASLRTAVNLYPEGDWNVRRFRPNLFIDIDADGWVEDSWCGQALRIGGVLVAPRERCIRCTMVTRPQPGLERDVQIYKSLSRHHGGTLGTWTQVHAPGAVHVGDVVEVVR